MFDIHTIKDIGLLRESYELECKKAGGRDSRGAVPESFWETYSAMANTGGGVLLLGFSEKGDTFELFNLEDTGRLKKDIFSTANNTSKVSINLLSNQSVKDIQIDGKTILRVDIRNEQLLTSTGRGRGAVYHLKGFDLPYPDDVFGKATNSPLNGGGSPLNGGSSPCKKAEFLRDSQGRLISDYHREPLIDNLEYRMPEKLREIEALAQLPREKQRTSREQMRSVIMEICREQYVTLGALAALVNRKPKPLQAQYLSPMFKEKQLKLAFSATPNDLRQAYITASRIPEDLGKGKSK